MLTYTKNLFSTFLMFSLLFVFSCSKEDNSSSNPYENPSSNTNLNNRSVGESARELLSAENYESLTIEILVVEGYEPSNAVLSSLQGFMESYLNKPDGININTTTVSSPGSSVYTLDALVEYENQHRSAFTTEEEIAVYIFITDGNYENDNVLGLAYRNTSIAIMGGKIESLTGGFGEPSEDMASQTVLRHEIAHLLGLVNNGTPMIQEHQDEEHGHHCNVESCLMYYAVENGDFLSNLLGASGPPELDSQCQADLEANGGK